MNKGSPRYRRSQSPELVSKLCDINSLLFLPDETSAPLKKARKVRSRAAKLSIRKVKDEVKAEASADRIDADDDEDKMKREVKNKSEGIKKDQDLVLKKRTRKQAKMERCDFLDFEAVEDDEREEKKGRRSVRFQDEINERGKSSFVY